MNAPVKSPRHAPGAAPRAPGSSAAPKAAGVAAPAAPARTATAAKAATAGKPVASAKPAAPTKGTATARPTTPDLTPARAPAQPAGKKKRLRLPPPGRRIGSENVLWAAVALSLVAHAAALAVHFVIPGGLGKRHNDKGLEIVLVNSKHKRAPKDAQVMAQANIDAGGNTAEKFRATTPLPPQEQQQEGEALIQQQKRMQELEELQRELLTQSRQKRPTSTAPTAKEATAQAAHVQGVDLVENARKIQQLEAEIAKNQQEYNQRPRKNFVGVRAVENRFARYVEDWRSKIERVGTLNFPHADDGKLYGSLQMTVEIRADGSVASIEIGRSSGKKALDAAAVRIVRLGEPYAPFPPDVRKDTDILSISRTWNFTKGDTVESAPARQ